MRFWLTVLILLCSNPVLALEAEDIVATYSFKDDGDKKRFIDLAKKFTKQNRERIDAWSSYVILALPLLGKSLSSAQRDELARAKAKWDAAEELMLPFEEGFAKSSELRQSYQMTIPITTVVCNGPYCVPVSDPTAFWFIVGAYVAGMALDDLAKGDASQIKMFLAKPAGGDN